MKRVFGTLAFLSFFWLLGLVGAIEQNTMAFRAKGGEIVTLKILCD